jgi:hypothetical protein
MPKQVARALSRRQRVIGVRPTQPVAAQFTSLRPDVGSAARRSSASLSRAAKSSTCRTSAKRSTRRAAVKFTSPAPTSSSTTVSFGVQKERCAPPGARRRFPTESAHLPDRRSGEQQRRDGKMAYRQQIAAARALRRAPAPWRWSRRPGNSSWRRPGAAGEACSRPGRVEEGDVGGELASGRLDYLSSVPCPERFKTTQKRAGAVP